MLHRVPRTGMSTTTSIPTSAPLPRSSSLSAGGHLHGDASAVNGHHSHVHDHSTAPNSAGLSNASKKGKMKKTTDPNEASKLIAAKISQLELDAAGEKDQEAEIGASSYLHRYAVARPTMHDLPPALHQRRHCRIVWGCSRII